MQGYINEAGDVSQLSQILRRQGTHTHIHVQPHIHAVQKMVLTVPIVRDYEAKRVQKASRKL